MARTLVLTFRSFKKSEDSQTFDRLMALRKAVFEDEQGVPEAPDAIDDVATHWLLLDEHDQLAGIARTYPSAEYPGAIQIGRIAIPQSFRGLGYGKALIENVMSQLLQQGHPRFTLHGQTHAKGFYGTLGFQSVGEEFLEDGIPHFTFVKRHPL